MGGPNDSKQKNTGIELLRIIACFMVILAHIHPVLILDDGQIADGALLVQSFLAPGVGLFFLITGCFIPKMPVRKAWRKFFLGIALPTLIFVFCVDLLEGYLDSTADIFTSIRQSDVKHILSSILKGIIAFDASQLGRLNGHIWFVFSYAVIMLWLPLLHALVKADARRPLIFFSILSVLKLFAIDINRLWPFPVVLYLPELPGTLGRLVLKVGSVTFPVFLLHFPLVHKLRTAGIEARVMEFFGASQGAGAIVYSFIYAAMVFILSAVIYSVFRMIYKNKERIALWK